MDELFKTLRRFIARDFVFVIGGSSMIATFLYLFDRLPGPESAWVLWVLLGGVGYFLAYALQDGLSLTGLLTTVYIKNPGPFVRVLYKRFMREAWVDIPMDVDLKQARELITEEQLLVRLERIVTFKQVGTTGGPCLIVSATMFFARWIAQHERFDLALSASGLVIGVVLLMLGWVKGAQQAAFIARHGKSKAV